MTQLLEQQAPGCGEDLTHSKGQPSGPLKSNCPSCKGKGYVQGWYAEGVTSLVEFLCYDLSCPRARVPWYVYQLRPERTHNSCPVCGKVYLTVFTAKYCPEIYIHKVERRNALDNGLLVITEACRLENHGSAQAVGVGS